MKSYSEWLTEWAKRLVDDARSQVEHHKHLIAELNASRSDSDSNKRECTEWLMVHHQKMIDTIAESHQQWREFAKHRWNVDVPELLI